MSERGFILQPTYRIEAGRPVVHLYGRLAGGGSFLVRDDRHRPSFYVASDDAERALACGAEQVEPCGWRNLDGREVARVTLRVPGDAPPLRDRLQAAGIRCYEADVRFATRYLMRRGIRGAVLLDGPFEPGDGIGRVYRNPELQPAEWTPGPYGGLDVLSFDIETDPKARRLLSVALHGCGVSEVLLFCPEGYTAPAGAIGFRHERQLLAAFAERVRELDPDVLTGWNVVDFDLRVLDRLARRFAVPLWLGRGPGTLRLRESRAAWSSLEATVPGRVVLDGIQLLRGSFVKMEEYSLDFVSRKVLGVGKVMSGHDRGQEIVDAFLNDRERFVTYNLTDARLVLEILDELGLVKLAVERSLLTGLPIDRVAGAIAALDFLYLSELGKRKVVAPSVEAGTPGEANLGGEVLEPEPGLYTSVLVCDFKSLYPSIIRTFQVDPLGYVNAPRRDAILAPNGAAFSRQGGILPRLVDELFPRREAAKAEGREVASHAIKILMNSFYGVLGTPACRFYRPQLAGAITAFGREILLWSKDRVESYGYRVLYGDTDSLFILSGSEDVEEASALGGQLVTRLNRDLTQHVRQKWGVESRLELEFERLYRRLLLPSMRSGRGGARKRYAGLVGEGEKARVVFTGMEVVRRDWTELAKNVQRELYERLFFDRKVGGYLRGVVEELRGGRLDELLVYRKGLRKDLGQYTSTTPPHVAAARKMKAPAGRLVAYVMTVAGAEPAGERQSPIDYEHYVQKQVRPVAEPVLGVLGLDFDKVVGDDAQMELF